ncbi:MAG: FG-GAP-like repeat-containing protein [Nanoarchaeota archaeon]|nr:FG-GAP-like repeat-containing protein [Nanoarchaeota archaeon]
MKMQKKLVSIVATCAVLAGLAGCVKSEIKEIPSEEAKKQKTATYFASVPMDYKTGAAAVTGDFDGDGDLDIIVIARDNNVSATSGRLYLFKNDGKGNFYQDTIEDYEKYDKG